MNAGWIVARERSTWRRKQKNLLQGRFEARAVQLRLWLAIVTLQIETCSLGTYYKRGLRGVASTLPCRRDPVAEPERYEQKDDDNV
jgi:hypothetical protein